MRIYINTFKIKLPKIKFPKIKIKWPKLKKGLAKIWKEVKRDVKKAYKFLKDNGIYDIALKLIKTVGKEFAVGACTAEGVAVIVCQEMVDLVAKNI